MTQSGALNWKLWLLISVAVFALDQVTKLWILDNFVLGDRQVLLPFFNLVHVHNYGAAFSFLSEQPGWQRWFLLAVTSVISVVLLVWLTRLQAQQKLLALSLALILGGALGNLYDRAVYGYVVDFIDWHVNGYHWPAFNIADAGISCGAVLLILDTFINPEPKAKDKAPNSKEEGAN
ncbi:MAG: signal peptidase II [Gammaproteobacteria bacterium]